MASPLLSPLWVDPLRPEAILPSLYDALAGKAHLLPLPGGHSAADRSRAQLLRTTMRLGEEVDATTALILATSGSTGTPKGALLSADNLVSSAVATHNALSGPGLWVLALPAHHIAGIQVCIRSLIAETTPLICPIHEGFSVETFSRISMTAHAQAQSQGLPLYVSLVPQQLLKALETLQGIEALRCYTAILVGGAGTRAETLESCRQLGIHIVTTYGSSETSGGCVYNGVPIDWAEVRIQKERIYLGGPMVASGYRNVAHAPELSEPGWFATSDTGFIEDGILHVTGRLDMVIDTGGLKLHPNVLEEQILRCPGVEEVCVLGIPDARFGQAIVCAYVGTASQWEIIETLEDLPRWQLPKQFRTLDALPLTPLGKVNRPALAELFTSS